jgi:hypothetical protein
MSIITMNGRIKEKLEGYRCKGKRRNTEMGKRDMIKRVH